MGLIKNNFQKKPLIGLNNPITKIEPIEVEENSEEKVLGDSRLGGLKSGGLKLNKLNAEKEKEVAQPKLTILNKIGQVEKEETSENINYVDDVIENVQTNLNEQIELVTVPNSSEEIKEENVNVEVIQKVEKAVEENKVEKVTENTIKVTDKKKKVVKAKKDSVKAEINKIESKVNEKRRVSINDMDSCMYEIIAPTTETWEAEKEEILNLLKDITISQDMTSGEIKQALASLDELRFEIFPRQHDAERCFDGTTQIYKRVKSLAIAEGNATNAEARNALGIIALQNYTTPNGDVIDLNEYMLYIEEKHKFYQKTIEAIQFKSYSLVNFNKTLESEKI